MRTVRTRTPAMPSIPETSNDPMSYSNWRTSFTLDEMRRADDREVGYRRNRDLVIDCPPAALQNPRLARDERTLPSGVRERPRLHVVVAELHQLRPRHARGKRDTNS